MRLGWTGSNSDTRNTDSEVGHPSGTGFYIIDFKRSRE